ncbi:hypothetical protein ACJRO7_004153 [Eucalyptus globulus]|uniref:DUF4220 domain-containing protein n=1 Tax=Eucalyptus globulus TaxID=34317 RepID=A0ABD3J1R1_EUCGL
MGITTILAEARNLSMKFNLRGAILTRLSLQVFLIFFAPMRKRWSNRWFRTLMWLAYLVADSVAIYAFGLLAKAQINGCISDSKVDAYGDLLAFWAPFLLLHLGGPDTITAFALEDNELWGRHLLNLLFQLGTACYVFYQSLPSNKLIVPTFFVFIGGTIKYIERTCALYLARFSKLRGSLLPSLDANQDSDALIEMISEHNIKSRNVGEQHETDLGDREVIKAAYFYFATFKGLLVELPFDLSQMNRSWQFFRSRIAKDAFRVIEGELNFFYDVLYTKAAVVHCPTVYLFRAISVGSVVTAFALFYVLNKPGFHEYDIKITYTLLLGAVGLEFVALSMLICSDRTFVKVGTSQKHHRSLFTGCIFIKFLHKFKSKSSPFALHILHARWSRSIFQYNLIDSQLSRWPKWIEKLLDLISLWEFFDDMKPGRRVPFTEKLGELIFYELKRKRSTAEDMKHALEICAARGEWALDHSETKQDCTNLLPFVRTVDYDESLLLWHVATELCYNMDTEESTDFNTNCVNSKALSDYMLHLIIKQPDMMSAIVGLGEIRFQYTCDEVDKFLREISSIGSKMNITKKSVCGTLLAVSTGVHGHLLGTEKISSVLSNAGVLSRELQSIERKDRWKIMSKVWVELLGYAAQLGFYQDLRERERESVRSDNAISLQVYILSVLNTKSSQFCFSQDNAHCLIC